MKNFIQFRLAVHKLAIETGRFENIDRANRICKLCNSMQIKTEYHFLRIFPKFNDLRETFYNLANCNPIDQYIGNKKQKDASQYGKLY